MGAWLFRYPDWKQSQLLGQQSWLEELGLPMKYLFFRRQIHDHKKLSYS
jgi:hypothetical protein